MTVIPFPDRNPRCCNCRFWTPNDGRSPAGWCERHDEQTNCDHHCSDYRCEEHKGKAG